MFDSQRATLNQELARLAADLPETRWIVLLSKDGVNKAVFPEFVGETDRLSAMSAATLSLGERITRELKGGEMRYTLIGGTYNLHLIIALGKDHMLVLGLRPTVSLDSIFKALQASITPLLEELKVELPANWLNS